MTDALITADELVERMLDGAGTVVVDTRPPAARADWAIPGSITLDELPTSPAELGSTPVVVVCAAGRSALAVAADLREQGYDAVTLEHGMRGWSTAWQALAVPLAKAQVKVLQVARLGKGCLSYMLVDGGEAAVVDPALPVPVYLTLAQQHGARITHVLDTHVHADHLSRARELAGATGATLVQPSGGRLQYEALDPRHGDRINIGTTVLEVMATPGHTFESVTYLVVDAAGETPVAALTGDTLFAAAVGRPDLKAAAREEALERAALLHDSLHALLARGADDTIVLPGHCTVPTPGHVDAAPLRVVRAQPALALDRDGFVAQVTTNLPPTPENHERIVARNEAGAPFDGSELELEAGANRCAVSVGS